MNPGAAYEDAMEAWGERLAERMENSFTPEWEAQMEAWGEQMENWGEEFAEQWGNSEEFQNWQGDVEEWAEQWAEQWEEGEFDEQDAERLEREIEIQLRRAEQERQREQLRRDQGMQRAIQRRDQEARRQQAQMARAMGLAQRQQERRTRMQEEALRRAEERQQEATERMSQFQGLREGAIEIDQIGAQYMLRRNQNPEEFMKRQLVQDGIIKANASKVKIKTNGEELKINGTQLSGQEYHKYRSLLESSGVGFCEGCSSSMTIYLD